MNGLILLDFSTFQPQARSLGIGLSIEMGVDEGIRGRAYNNRNKKFDASSEDSDEFGNKGRSVNVNDDSNQLSGAYPNNATIDQNTLDNFSINIDKQKISQVVRNLLSNALKFTPKGGGITVKATIVLLVNIDSSNEGTRATTSLGSSPDCSLSPPYFRFEVTDTGAGISAVRLRVVVLRHVS